MQNYEVIKQIPAKSVEVEMRENRLDKFKTIWNWSISGKEYIKYAVYSFSKVYMPLEEAVMSGGKVHSEDVLFLYDLIH